RGRPERRHLDLELADIRLGAVTLAAERVEPVGQMDLLDAGADHGEGAAREEGRARERDDQHAPRAEILFVDESLFVFHESRSSTRSFALRARGFARTSSSSGPRGDGSSSTKPADSRARNVRFTMRSSPEWKEMTPSLPPAASKAGASSRAWRRAPGSSLTAMRRAWKVRVATWMRVDQARRGGAREVAEALVCEAHAPAEGREPRARARERLSVHVEPEQENIGRARRQERLSVPAHTHCPVDHPSSSARSQEKRDLVREYRNVNRYTPKFAS